MHEIEQRSVIGKGEHMLKSGHPAPHSIEVGVVHYVSQIWKAFALPLLENEHTSH